VLQDRLIFSQHAQTRMQSRQIQLTREDAKQLSQAMDEAGRKGSKQAAVILGPDIYIVAPPSRTVITSIHPPAEGMKVISQVDTVVYVSRTSHALGGTLGLSSVHPGEEASGSRSTEGTPAASHWSLISSLEESSGEEGEV
jgi:flagellar operon protein